MHSIFHSISKSISQLQPRRLWKMSTLFSSLLIALCLRSLKALWGQKDKQTVTHSRLKRHWNALKWLSFVFYHSLMVLAVSPWNSGALWLHWMLNTFIYTYTLYKQMKKKKKKAILLPRVHANANTYCHSFTYSFMLLKGKPQLPTCRDNPPLTVEKTLRLIRF